MANVTMNGVEYAGLLMREQQLHEILNWLLSDRKVNFKGDIPSYNIGNWPEKAPMPSCLREVFVQAMVARILCDLDHDELKLLVGRNAHYYNYVDGSLRDDNYWNAQNTVDLLQEDSRVADLWAKITQELAEEPDEESKEEHDDE